MRRRLAITTRPLAASLLALALAAPGALAQSDQSQAGAAATDQSATTGTQGADAAATAQAESGTEAAGGGSDTSQDQPAMAGTDSEQPTMAGEQPGMAGEQGHQEMMAGEQPGMSGQQGHQGMMAGEPQGGMMMSPDEMGQTVMLDIEGFAQEIYERGFRQGYIRGVTDARTRMVRDIQRMRQQAARAPMARGSDSGQPASPPVGAAPAEGMRQQGMQQPPEGMQQQRMQQQPQGMQQPGDMQQEGPQMTRRDRGGERGTIIVLPPGVSPEAFIEQMMRANEGDSGG